MTVGDCVITRSHNKRLAIEILLSALSEAISETDTMNLNDTQSSLHEELDLYSAEIDKDNMMNQNWTKQSLFGKQDDETEEGPGYTTTMVDEEPETFMETDIQDKKNKPEVLGKTPEKDVTKKKTACKPTPFDGD